MSVIVWQSKDIVAVSPSHGFLVTPYLVPHFSEVWKCGIVWQSGDIVAVSPSHELLVILYLVLHFLEMWKCGIVWQSKDIVALFPSNEPLVILYLVPHFSEVWKYGIAWQVEFNVALSMSHEKLSAPYEHLVLLLYRFLRFSLRTIFFFWIEDITIISMPAVERNLKLRNPISLWTNLYPYHYASTLIIVRSRHISTVS